MGSSIYAQKRIPVIKANSKSVNVRDGKDLKKDAWNISPEIKLDIYLTPNKNKKVTFYTDLDSITFFVQPNKEYNFIIILNNKDTAFTQIKYQATNLDKLKSANKYNPFDVRPIPAFTYQNADNANLIELRKLNHLRGIYFVVNAGGNNEDVHFSTASSLAVVLAFGP